MQLQYLVIIVCMDIKFGIVYRIFFPGLSVVQCVQKPLLLLSPAK
jgi:hypothetical protein